MTAPPDKSPLQIFKEIVLIPFDNSIINTVPEIGHLAPIILTGGALFLSVVTLNYPIAVFAGSTMEASLIYRLIAPMAHYVATPTNVPKDSPEAVRCESYFQTLTASRFKGLLDNGLVPAFPFLL